MTSEQKLRTINLLRNALRETTGNEEIDKISNETMLAGLVGTDTELLNVYVQEVGPAQAEVDLHLDGDGVNGHTTNAAHFATFVARISDAVKWTSKEMMGRQRYTSELLIEGVTPGSVRVVLKAPPEKRTASDPVPGTEGSTVDSQALRRIAQVMTLASNEEGVANEALDAAVQTLPLRAKTSLRSAVTEARKAGWDIDGDIKERHKGINRVRLSNNGAIKLDFALRQDDPKLKVETATGTIDGLKYSLGVMWFQPETSGHSFAASVPDDKLLVKVAELAKDKDQLVKAVFDSFESIDETRGSVVKISRVLKSIKPIDAVDQTSMTLQQLHQKLA